MLRCRGLSFGYPDAGGKGEGEGKGKAAGFVLRDISLAVEPGEVLGIAGCSGSGKSTLLGCLAGELEPSSGAVEADGIVPGGEAANRRAFRQLVGMVHQLPEEQLFARTVAEDVAFGPRNLGLDPDEVDACVSWALGSVGLDPGAFGERNPFTLSGGEARRVAIAGILALRPRYLLLDEPTAGLDPRERDRLLELLVSLSREGLGIVFVSHDISALARCCSKVALLRDGQVVSSGGTADVLGDVRAVHAAGLVPTAEVELAERLRARGITLPAGITDAARLAEALRGQSAQARSQVSPGEGRP